MTATTALHGLRNGASRLGEWLNTLLMVSALSMTPLLHAEQQYGDFTYTSDGSVITITKFSETGAVADIPNTINGLPVRNIEAYAFSGCDALTSISIPANVNNIDPDAIVHTYALQTITVDTANSAYSSHDGMLFNKARTILLKYPLGRAGGCVMPAGVTQMQDQAFNYARELTSIALPASFAFFDPYRLGFAPKLTAFTVAADNGVFSALDGVLFNKERSRLIKCPQAKSGSYNVPSGVTVIGKHAFRDCKAMSAIILPAGVQTIESYTFCNVDAGSIILPETLLTIQESAFESCKGITELVLPNSITEIGFYAFYGCYNLTSIKLPDGLTTAREFLLSSCYNLAMVEVPASVTLVKQGAFAYCPNMTAICFMGNAPTLGAAVFTSSNKSVVYHLPDTTGWPVAPGLWGGRPTALIELDGTFQLAVNGGSGSGTYMQEEVVAISADTPPAGEVFDRWVGDTAGVADIYAASTTLVMPDRNTVLSATYKPGIYTLTVVNGSGNGNYYYRDYVTISANPAPPGMYFHSWSGGYPNVPLDAPATVSFNMPAKDLTVTAVYNAPGYQLSVGGGSGSGTYTNGQRVAITASAPPAGKIFAGWSGDTQHVVNPQSAATMVVMPAQAVALTATYAATYALNVNHGYGSGVYTNGQLVSVSANVPDGKSFSHWSGDTQYIADTQAAATTLTMPAQAVTVTAVYCTLHQLTVVNGSGSGIYTNGQQVTVSANPVEQDYTFYRWCYKAVIPYHNPERYQLEASPHVADAAATTTTFTMPSSDYTLYATCTALSAGHYTAEYPTPEPGELRTCYLTGYSGPGGMVKVPHTIQGVSVTGLFQTFENNTSITGAVIPEPILHLSAAFSGCTALTSVNLPATLKGLGYKSFYLCSNLTYVSPLPSGLEEVGEAAFHNCRSLTQINLPQGLKRIKPEAFYYCSSLAGITLPDGLEEIGTFAFTSCSSLSRINIPDSVTNLGGAMDSGHVLEGSVFSMCRGLAQVEIGSGVQFCPFDNFFLCTNLQSITVAPGNAAFLDIDGVFFGRNPYRLLKFPTARTGRYTIPSGVAAIEWGAFLEAGVHSVVVPASVTEVGEWALYTYNYGAEQGGSYYFKGNAPTLIDTGPGYNVGNGIVYYLQGTSGWEPMYGNCETRVWGSGGGDPGGGDEPGGFRVTDVSPMDQEQYVPRVNLVVSAKFSGDVNGATVDENTFAVCYFNDPAAIPGSISVEGKKITFTAHGVVDAVRPRISVVIAGGAAGVRGAGGQALATDRRWDFETMSGFSVTGVEPEDQTTGIFRDKVSVVAHFSEYVKPASVNATTFAVCYDDNHEVIPGSYSVSGQSAVFSPEEVRPGVNSRIRVTIKGGPDGILPADGYGPPGAILAGDTVWHFTTRPAVTIAMVPCQAYDHYAWVCHKEASCRVTVINEAESPTVPAGPNASMDEGSITGHVSMVWNDHDTFSKNDFVWKIWDGKPFSRFLANRKWALEIYRRNNNAVFSTINGMMPRYMISSTGWNTAEARVELTDSSGKVYEYTDKHTITVLPLKQGRARFRIHFVPLPFGDYEFMGIAPTVMPSLVARHIEILRKIYPLPAASVVATYDSSVVDVSRFLNHLNPLNLANNQYLSAIYMDLESYREQIGADVMIGIAPLSWVKENTGALGITGAHWFNVVGLPVALVGDTTEAQVTAHEIGHMVAYDGSVFQHSSHSPDLSGFDPFTETHYAVGRLPLAAETGDLMDVDAGNNPDGTTWVNFQTYSLLADYFVDAATAPLSMAQPASRGMTGMSMATPLGGSDEPLLSVRGMISYTAAGYKVEAIHIRQVEKGAASSGSASGDFIVQTLNSQGALLQSLRIDPLFLSGDSGDLAFFTLRFTNPESIHQISVRYKGNLMSAALRPAVPPSVAVTQPQAGAQIGGPLQLAWSGSGGTPENPLTYSLFYRPDPSMPWRVVAYEITGNTLQLAAGELPSGANAQIRVVASDGFNTVEALSAAFETCWAPRVALCAPALDEAFADPLTSVTLHFSEPLDPTSISSESVRLLDTNGVAVAGIIHCAPGEQQVAFMPEQPLQPLAVYTVRVDSAVSTPLGATLEAEFISRFTVSSGALPPEVQLAAPTAPGVLTLDAPCQLTALAEADTGRTISAVSFYAGGELLGEVTSEPYVWEWTPTEAGMCTVVARARDDEQRLGSAGGASFRIAPSGVIYTAADNAALLSSFNGSGDISLPEMVDGKPLVAIGSDAFRNAQGLTRVSLPESITHIGAAAFADCASLAALYCRGNAPDVAANAFKGSGHAAIYYLPGTTGWPLMPATFGGAEAILWQPQIMAGTGFGIYDGKFGFVVTNAGSPEVVIEAATNLHHQTWRPLATNILHNGALLFEDQDTRQHPSRFYRLRMP